MNSRAEQPVAEGTEIRDLMPKDRQEWESLYRQYAEFYREPMNEDSLGRTWSSS